ncbi:MAG: hypothetical protein FWD89_04435 [Firmicutes bacterium]|nr:hypothetical protein [Bacillota bacterium]
MVEIFKTYRNYFFMGIAVLSILASILLPTLVISIAGAELSVFGIGGQNFEALDNNLFTAGFWILSLLVPVAIIVLSVLSIVLKKDFTWIIAGLFVLHLVMISLVWVQAARAGVIADLNGAKFDEALAAAIQEGARGQILLGLIGGGMSYELAEAAVEAMTDAEVLAAVGPAGVTAITGVVTPIVQEIFDGIIEKVTVVASTGTQVVSYIAILGATFAAFLGFNRD